MQAQLARDRQLSALLSAVRAFLPNMQRAGGGKTSDYLVHPTTLASVRRRFDLVSSTLLRNDCTLSSCPSSPLVVSSDVLLL